MSTVSYQNYFSTLLLSKQSWLFSRGRMLQWPPLLCRSFLSFFSSPCQFRMAGVFRLPGPLSSPDAHLSHIFLLTHSSPAFRCCLEPESSTSLPVSFKCAHMAVLRGEVISGCPRLMHGVSDQLH
jgi:hypothetical protein